MTKANKVINLKIDSYDLKKKFMDMLHVEASIPKCLNCGFLFSLGFPDSYQGLSDFLICQENNLLCECDNFKKLNEEIKNGKERKITISHYYHKV